MRVLTSTLCALLVASCAAVDREAVDPDRAPSPRNAGILETDRGRAAPPSLLAVEVRDVRIVQGRAIRVRGSVTNPYEEDVEGVRYRLRLLSTDGSRLLSTEYEEVDSFVAAESTSGFELELEGVYFATVPRFLIDAIPRELGGQPYQPPTDWGR